MQSKMNQFTTVIENGVVKEVGKSSVLQPKTNFKGGSIKWFDDSRLIRTPGKQIKTI